MDNAHRIVSSEAEELILVDVDDNETGFLSKAECHDGDGVLHRAFSVFLFNGDGELLLQQRAPSKRLWPGYWSNSCCSHPRRGESMHIATRRRLRDELNIETELEFIYKFSYEANFGDTGSENELCYVYLGKVTGEIQKNDSEISAVRFVSTDDLAKEFAETPETITPWFRMEWQELNEVYAHRLAAFGAKVPVEE